MMSLHGGLLLLLQLSLPPCVGMGSDLLLEIGVQIAQHQAAPPLSARLPFLIRPLNLHLVDCRRCSTHGERLVASQIMKGIGF